jgi:hypothetical protein
MPETHRERVLRGSEIERELRDSPRKSSNRYVDRYACRNWDTLGATAWKRAAEREFARIEEE